MPKNCLMPGCKSVEIAESGFEQFSQMIELAGGLTLSQVCAISGLDQMSVQNWVKRLFVSRPIAKKYYGKQLARILLINALRGAMQIDEIGRLMVLINGDVEDESDDLISEELLYTLFVKTVFFYDGDVRVIGEIVQSFGYQNDKLNRALEIMLYAYLAAENKKIAALKLAALERGKNV